MDLEIVSDWNKARSGAGRVAVASGRVCTTLYVWVLCNLRLLYGNTLMNP